TKQRKQVHTNRASQSRHKYYLAKLSSIFHQFVCTSRFVQRQHSINYASYLAFLNKLHCREELRFRSHKRPEKCQVTIKHLANVCSRIIPACGPASYKPTAVSKSTNRTFPSGRSRMFEHNAYHHNVFYAPDFLGPIAVGIVDNVIGAQFTRFSQLLVRTSCGNHAGTEQLADLNGDRSHA